MGKKKNPRNQSVGSALICSMCKLVHGAGEEYEHGKGQNCVRHWQIWRFQTVRGVICHSIEEGQLTKNMIDGSHSMSF